MSERADAGRLRWQDTEYVFTSTVGTAMEPRNVSRDSLCAESTASLDVLNAEIDRNGPEE